MKSVNLLKKELKAALDTTEIIDVMKKSAGSQFQNLELRSKTDSRRNLGALLRNFLSLVDVGGCSHAFVTGSGAPPSVVLFTSDEGYVGGMNLEVVNVAMDFKEKNNAELIVIGDRGSMALEERDETFTYFPGISDELSEEEVTRVKDYLLHHYLTGKTGRLMFVYPRFVSFAHQSVGIFQVLPAPHVFTAHLTVKPKPPDGVERRLGVERRTGEDRRLKMAMEKGGDQLQQIKKRILAKDRRRGKERRKVVKVRNPTLKGLSVEPSVYSVVDYLGRLWMDSRVYNVMRETKMSEFAARSIHLEGSHQEFTRSNKQLKLEYRRSMHEAVDKAIREVFASKLFVE